jgi:hypothetical protein
MTETCRIDRPVTQVDWMALIDDVALLLGVVEPVSEQRLRASTVAVAAYLDVPRSTLRNWLDGSEPKHSDGERLLRVWVCLTGKAETFAPRTRRTFSAADIR